MISRWNSVFVAIRDVAFALLTLTAFPLFGHSTPPADVIMENADQMNRPKYEVVQMKMELVAENDQSMVRKLVWHFVNENKTRTSLLKFNEPASVRGVGTLVIESGDKMNTIWHYLPATRNVRRIAAEQRQNRFMGTEFVFEDFEGLKLNKYKFELMGTEACQQTSHCYVVKGKPSDLNERNTSCYNMKIFWVDQDSFVIVKTELYDRNGKLAKVYENSSFRQLGQYWRPRCQTMRNLLNGCSTVMTEIERKIDDPFDRYFVSQQYLRSE